MDVLKIGSVLRMDVGYTQRVLRGAWQFSIQSLCKADLL